MPRSDQEFFIETKVGRLLVGVVQNKISKIAFHQPRNASVSLKPKVVKKLENQLLEYFNGHRKTFQLAFHLEGTDFQQQVWSKILDIPYGKTISYGKLAAQLGDIKKIRAVANALGKNPIPIIVPCHRVVGVNGELTGYIGGLPTKKYLIGLESNRQLELF